MRFFRPKAETVMTVVSLGVQSFLYGYGASHSANRNTTQAASKTSTSTESDEPSLTRDDSPR